MNKAFVKLICLLVLVCMMISVFAGCNAAGNDGTTPPTGDTQATDATKETEGTIDEVDYAAYCKLDLSSETAKTEATVESFVDGDTTWFHVDSDIVGTSLLKARYISINTPESTGTIEEWGKAAARFTREKLSQAVSIIIESDDANWNIDSTGTRYLVWVWYKTSEDSEYRNLNIEILQNGLAIASSSNNNRYGNICMNAITQARALKYHIYSGQKDPDFYYGDCVELTLKELRTNLQYYNALVVEAEMPESGHIWELKETEDGYQLLNALTGMGLEYDADDACWGVYVDPKDELTLINADSGEASKTITDGRYVISDKGKALTSLGQSQNYGNPKAGNVSNDSTLDVFTITNVEGGITIQDAYGRYVCARKTYGGTKVAFSGIVTKNANNTCYVECYDVETDMYYGMTVYYGYGLSAAGMRILDVGNEVRIVGSLQFYEGGGTWQVADVDYRAMKPNDPNNIQKLSEGNSAAYRVTDPATFLNSQVEVVDEEGNKETFSYAELSMSSSISMENLKVIDAYTTDNEESSSNGALTLYCQAEDGTRISVRTMVLHDAEGNLVTQDQYLGKTIHVKGIVDFYKDSYQIKVFNTNDIEIVG